MVLKNEPIEFVLGVPNNFQGEGLVLTLNNGGRDKIAKPKIKVEKNRCSIQYAFEKSGLYDVHIKKNDTHMATYVVRVKRKL